MEEKRPVLNKDLDSETFKEYYYLKEELVNFLKSENLKSNGNKKELTEKIAYYLKTGKELKITKKTKTQHKNLSLNGKIGPNFNCSEEARGFFKSHIGDNFKFKVNFQKWLKENPDKTFKDAIDIYDEITKTKPKNIDKQFEYNTYIRDFFKNNDNLTLKDAIKCWNYKKSIKGSNKYDKNDLKILK